MSIENFFWFNLGSGITAALIFGLTFLPTSYRRSKGVSDED